MNIEEITTYKINGKTYDLKTMKDVRTELIALNKILEKDWLIEMTPEEIIDMIVKHRQVINIATKNLIKLL